MRESDLRKDEDIQDEIEESYFQSPILTGQEIDLKVENGIVTLNGDVDSKLMTFEAESIAQEISGVKEVINLLRLRPNSITLSL